MSFLNSGIDVANFMGNPFDTQRAVEANSRAKAFLEGGAAKRTGDLAGQGPGLFGYYKGKNSLADAGAYANQKALGAELFGKGMAVVGAFGGRAAMGGFGGGPTAEIGGKTYGVDLSGGEIDDLTIETGAGPGNNFMLPQLFN